jgi:hypothetical protein
MAQLVGCVSTECWAKLSMTLWLMCTYNPPRLDPTCGNNDYWADLHKKCLTVYVMLAHMSINLHTAGPTCWNGVWVALMVSDCWPISPNKLQYVVG